ncbi:Dot/Icm T4SS effector AnkG/AnkZ/LegA7 [Legionella resiliens]|uniref:Ankyrin repeat domain-containing protein n=1 Tax=Legionella resiliens TaxID=2905958 RepID=A0ABS8X2G6_9GAMM|nr:MULTISPECIES: Dot/Icm T4SS effector AnkG/AnkZ/LegA7 [unclassified Legionella]MCE0722888.1 ankyrin repeat domain-containing protein [Legionella sp. 9fVS26]MCE3532041.1 ankyrin repeat domain-containing protein [Legionella sp. 8cVS16]
MEYVVYVLFLISLLIVVVHQLKLIPLNQLIPALSRQNALEHEDLLTLFDKFNYKHEDGVCHGFTLTWAQEAALGLDYQFYNRLNLIKREKRTLPNTLQAISEKIRSSQTLSRKEQKRNEIKPFLEAICLAQSPDDYHEIYAQAIQQSNIDTIYKMIQLNLCRNQNTVKNLFSKTISLASPQNVKEFLQQLHIILPAKNHVVVVCSSEEHTIGFKKYKDNTWLFMDINHLYEQSEEYPYQLLTSEELCPILYKSLFESSKRLVFHCSFIAQSGKRNLAQQIRAIDDLYPVSSENIQISNCRGYGALALAVQNDDRSTVWKILRLHNKSPVISQSELESALFYAAACNRSNIMNQLINIPKIDINSPCSHDDDSPLGVACRYGNESVVQLLLRNANINVNMQNAKGMTPLMLACKSSYTQKKPALFRLLLEAKANVTLINIDDETALDIAKKHDNQAALNIMMPASSKTAPKCSSNLSPSRPSGTIPTSGTFLNHSFFDKPDKSMERAAQGALQIAGNAKIK